MKTLREKLEDITLFVVIASSTGAVVTMVFMQTFGFTQIGSIIGVTFIILFGVSFFALATLLITSPEFKNFK